MDRKIEDASASAVQTALKEQEFLKLMKERTLPYRELMAYCRCTMMEVEAKFRVLNEELALKFDRNPIEAIHTRLKTTESILNKMLRHDYPITTESIEENLNDIAGIRVLCTFPSDIPMLEESFLQQDNIHLLKRKDYISNPKPNGYRSLHLIVETPIYLHDTKRLMKAEVQLRTLSMDWWASLEHTIRYKKDIDFSAELVHKLWRCAEEAAVLDKRMEEIQRAVRKENAEL